MTITNIHSRLQYLIFCTDVVESGDQFSILGLLDGIDVKGTIKRGGPVPDKILPMKLVLGVNTAPGTHSLTVGITQPSGGIMTIIDLEKFTLPASAVIHRCVASVEVSVPEDGLYSFNVYLDDTLIGSADLPISFAIEFID